MAIEKNFVVKNGLEVSTDLIVADANTNKVGIATTTASYTLHVNGGIGATDIYISGVSTFAGITTVTGSSLFTNKLDVSTDAFVVGVVTATTFHGNINAGVGTITNINNTNLTGTAATIADLNSTTGTFGSVFVLTNVIIDGNLSVGGTTSIVSSQTLRVKDADIILGITTDANNEDISTDITANHGGIAVASTEGTPLIDLTIAGLETAPATYKKIMWFRSGSFSGLGTDAWLTNYGVGIGSTQVPNGVRLAVDEIQLTKDTVKTRNLSVSGVTTLSSSGGITTTGGNLFVGGDLSVKGNILDSYNTGITTINYADILDGAIDASTANIQNLTTLVSSSHNNLFVSGISTFIGTSNLGKINASELTVSGVATFQNSTRIQNLTVDQNINASTGVVTASSFVGPLTGNADSATLAVNVNGSYVNSGVIEVSGISTFLNGPILVGSATSTNTDNQKLQITGNAYVSQNLGVGITNTNYKLGVVGDTYLNGDLLVSGVSTFQTNTNIENLIVTQNIDVSSGVVTAASFVGPLTGNVTGNVTGNITGTLTGSISSTTFQTTSSGVLVTGIATATTFNGNADLGVGTITTLNSTNATFTNLNVTGITTLGITTSTYLSASGIDVAGVTTSVGFAGTYFATGTSNFANNTVQNLVIQNYADKLNPLSISGAASTVNLSEGNFATLTLTDDVTFTFNTGIQTGGVGFSLLTTQDGVGNRSIVWPVTVNWPGGNAPSITTTANAVDLFVFFSPDNGANWYGNLSIADLY
jgi:hypothetical protein